MAVSPKKPCHEEDAQRNRRLDLLQSNTLNGIDYVEVREWEPKQLHVHFINKTEVSDEGGAIKVSITDGDRIPDIKVNPINSGDWSKDGEGRPVLRLHIAGRGDFSWHTIRIEGSSKLDPHFREARFSFYTFCPSRVDCLPGPEFCPDPEDRLPPIDYLAKDYDSFRQALSEFSALRFPEWHERSEADLGVMLLEALSAIGDDLSYLQDRIHQEAAIETATERRSIVRLARMVDYEPRPLTSARTLLQCKVADLCTTLPAGLLVMAHAPDSTEVPFEIGTGLRDTNQYPVNPKWNVLCPYWWDDGDRCLAVGSTSMYLEDKGLGLESGLALLIDTEGLTAADPPLRQVVTLVEVEELNDPLYGNKEVTRIQWRQEEGLTQHHDLTRTTVRGNLVPVTQGRRYIEHFAIPDSEPSTSNLGLPLAVQRLGANSTASTQVWQSLYSLQVDPLAYLENPETGMADPEIILIQKGATSHEWQWVRSMIEAGAFETKFTIDPAAWRPIMDTSGGLAHDYVGSQGSTIRFGDGAFGELPNGGDLFEVRYRVSRGLAGNVPADTIAAVDTSWSSVLLEVTNPFPAEGGADVESDEQVRRRAPFAFRTKTFRAVRPEDYDATVQALPWVQRAGTVFRWTGSWPTIFTTVDPKNSVAIDRDQHIQLIQLLNRYRLAGYECYAPLPVYVSLDIRIQVCAKPDAFQGDVYAGLKRALDPVRYPDGTSGFFHVDNFTFGTSFARSRLEAAIQGGPGVAGVLSIQYRRRGHLNSFVEMPPFIVFAPGEIFRLDNNASRPERGSYRIQVEGGK